jgi:superfamily I DNA/RNA helicase
VRVTVSVRRPTVAQFVPERSAEVIVSTAHKAKGREWARVRIADGFTPLKDSDQQDDSGRPVPGPIENGGARLAYVAVTRTRQRLDMSGLSWIDDHPEGNPARRHRGIDSATTRHAAVISFATSTPG